MATNQELANRFVNGATKGKTKSMFIEENAIYSYGYHFPIAIRNSNGTYSFNQDKYSVTTSHHQSNVRYAINGVNGKIIPSNIESLKKKIKEVI